MTMETLRERSFDVMSIATMMSMLSVVVSTETMDGFQTRTMLWWWECQNTETEGSRTKFLSYALVLTVRTIKSKGLKAVHKRHRQSRTSRTRSDEESNTSIIDADTLVIRRQDALHGQISTNQPRTEDIRF